MNIEGPIELRDGVQVHPDSYSTSIAGRIAGEKEVELRYGTAPVEKHLGGKLEYSDSTGNQHFLDIVAQVVQGEKGNAVWVSMHVAGLGFDHLPIHLSNIQEAKELLLSNMEEIAQSLRDSGVEISNEQLVRDVFGCLKIRGDHFLLESSVRL